MITVKRSCSSSNMITDDKITFYSFSVALTNDHAKMFADIHRYLHDDDKFDRVLMVRTLESVIDEGICAIAHQIAEEIDCPDTIPARMI